MTEKMRPWEKDKVRRDQIIDELTRLVAVEQAAYDAALSAPAPTFPATDNLPYLLGRLHGAEAMRNRAVAMLLGASPNSEGGEGK